MQATAALDPNGPYSSTSIRADVLPRPRTSRTSASGDPGRTTSAETRVAILGRASASAVSVAPPHGVSAATVRGPAAIDSR